MANGRYSLVAWQKLPEVLDPFLGCASGSYAAARKRQLDDVHHMDTVRLHRTNRLLCKTADRPAISASTLAPWASWGIVPVRTDPETMQAVASPSSSHGGENT